MITTGEGGMVTTRDDSLKRSMQLFRSHGVSRNREDFRNADTGPWSYQQVGLGFNYRMNEIAAALGCSQLKKLDDFVHQRTNIVRRYREELDENAFQIQYVPENNKPSWHLMVACLRSDFNPQEQRRRLIDNLISCGIGVNVHDEPVHLQPYFRDMGFTVGDFPVSECYAEKCLSLPLHPSLTEAEVSFVIEKINSFFEAKT